jgi:hypothetical protein
MCSLSLQHQLTARVAYERAGWSKGHTTIRGVSSQHHRQRAVAMSSAGGGSPKWAGEAEFKEALKRMKKSTQGGVARLTDLALKDPRQDYKHVVGALCHQLRKTRPQHRWVGEDTGGVHAAVASVASAACAPGFLTAPGSIARSGRRGGMRSAGGG